MEPQDEDQVSMIPHKKQKKKKITVYVFYQKEKS